MLGKLLKYDMKSLNRFLIVLHAFLLLSALGIRIFLTGRIVADNTAEGTILGLSFLLYILVITAANFGTFIVIAVRFYKNLYSDEGYLTHTLPATKGAHLLSKTISGTIWGTLDMILMGLSIYIVVATPFIMDVYHAHRAEILTEFGFIGRYADLTFPKILLFLLIFSIIGAFSSCITIYASVVLGQLFSGHRVLGAVVSYFAISTIVSILSFISLAALGLFTSKDLLYMRTADGGPFNFVAYMAGVLGLSTLLALIVGIILYILTYVLMNKKIDLA